MSPTSRVERFGCGCAILLALGLAGAQAVALAARVDAATLPVVLAGLLLGALLADGATGLVHWAADTWGDEHTPLLGAALIRAFREHHRDARAMLAHDWTSVNREPGIAAAAVLSLLSLPSVHRLLEGEVLVQALVLSFVAFGGAANQVHQWAHMDRPPRPVRLAQRCGLLLSPRRHARHHRGACTDAYCIATGWLNPTLDAVGFWRMLESTISTLTGAHARGAAPGSRRLSHS